jgi:hypothetical protein
MTKVKMSGMYILFGNALLSVIHLVEAEISTDWNTGDGGFDWRTNCDFPGDDIGQIPLTIATREECGRLCIANFPGDLDLNQVFISKHDKIKLDPN